VPEAGELVLVVGGAGRVGTRLVTTLRSMGVATRVMTRDRSPRSRRARRARLAKPRPRHHDDARGELGAIEDVVCVCKNRSSSGGLRIRHLPPV
jgi:nucleoside-diphosphate-sugar epimerase